jgi:Na+-transporting NADH:ubiquinone oxidoreductase subunit F
MGSMLTGLIVMSGFSAGLAALLVIADRFLADYGEVQVDINKGEKNLTVQGGGKLLGTLMEQGVFIPSACGGRGSCGLCKIKILEGAGPVLPTETPYLGPKELGDGLRMACQVRVRQNIRVEIPAALLSIREFRARLAGLKDLTPTIKEVDLALEEPREIRFKPGQFVQFQAPEYPGSPEPVYRAYSIASAASEPGRLTLTITRVPGGICTTYVHDHLKPGDTVRFNGPYGDFFLRDSDAEILMMATGSGLAPLISILRQMRDEKVRRKAVLFFGTRNREDLFYVEELRALEKELFDFTFVPVLSRPAEGDAWEGRTGLVTAPLIGHLSQGDNSKREAYLCGNPLMINSAVEIFRARGITDDRIFHDKFA